MTITTYLKGKLLNLLFSGTAWSGKPSTLYFAAFSVAPTISGGGTELSGGGYARVSMAASSGNFTVTTNALTNAAAISFPQATANWADVVAIGIYDAPSGGNLLFYFSVATQSVVRGMALNIAIGDLDLTFDAAFGDYAANKLLLHVFNASAWTAIGTHYFALGTGGTTTGVTGEQTIGANGYTRASKTNNVTNWPAAVSGVKSNGVQISFPASTGAWSSGSALTHFAIYDAASAGNCLWCGLLNASITVSGAGTTPNWAAAGDLSLTCE